MRAPKKGGLGVSPGQSCICKRTVTGMTGRTLGLDTNLFRFVLCVLLQLSTEKSFEMAAFLKPSSLTCKKFKAEKHSGVCVIQATCYVASLI